MLRTVKQAAVADKMIATRAGYSRGQGASLYKIISENVTFYLDILTTATASRDELDCEAKSVFGLFLVREREFGFGPAVVTEYPDISDPKTSPFLSSPLPQIAKRCQALDDEGPPVIRIVVLTTYGDRLRDILGAAGYTVKHIDMPAGPDQTYAFTFNRPGTRNGRTLYFEAVNETDEKIRPTFVVRMKDANGKLCGGACGSVHERDGVRYAYLATMALTAGLPATTGTKLARVLMDFLRQQGVKTMHLGTQTAGPFYENIGFRVAHHLVPALRTRIAADGSPIVHDLVIMTTDL